MINGSKRQIHRHIGHCFAYSYDSVGRKATETLAGGQVVSFGYDFAGQLTSEARSGTGGYATAYTYDNAGNRAGKTLNGVTESFTYDDANKVLTAGTAGNGVSATKSYTYDNAGNTKTVTTGSNVTTLTWDAAGRMTGITYPSGATNAFTYNGLGQRVGKTDSTGTFAYTLTDDSIDSAVVSDGAAVYRQAVGMIGEVRGGSKSYYNSDSLGSTRTVASNSGVATATRETDAFGNVWAPGTTGTMVTPFGFAGQHGYQTDTDSGLMRLGHRYYDSSTGRFLSRDPIQDGYNWYTYCANDPVNAVDPEGLEHVDLGFGIGPYSFGVLIDVRPGKITFHPYVGISYSAAPLSAQILVGPGQVSPGGFAQVGGGAFVGGQVGVGGLLTGNFGHYWSIGLMTPNAGVTVGVVFPGISIGNPNPPPPVPAPNGGNSIGGNPTTYLW